MHQILTICTILIFSAISFNAYSEAEVLTINSKIKPKSSDKYINAVHKEISTRTSNLHKTKYAILQGMLNTRGYKWVFEGEGEGFVLARFDYRGDTNIMRIEYNESLVQLKYHAAWGDYVCKKLVDDICYKNGRGYYNYIKNLRASIVREISNN